MKKLLQVDFAYHGPFGQDLAEALKSMADSINKEPGLIWKIWTENEKTEEAGGVYLFESEETASAYLQMHTARLKKLGVPEVRSRIFDVNGSLSVINRGPID